MSCNDLQLPHPLVFEPFLVCVGNVVQHRKFPIDAQGMPSCVWLTCLPASQSTNTVLICPENFAIVVEVAVLTSLRLELSLHPRCSLCCPYHPDRLCQYCKRQMLPSPRCSECTKGHCHSLPINTEFLTFH